jgi:hypothetical protein
MGTRSSKYTGFNPKRQADPRVLSDSEIAESRRLLLTAGIWDNENAELVPAPPSNRKERRHVLCKLRKHVKTKTGYMKGYARVEVPPKFPNR